MFAERQPISFYFSKDDNSVTVSQLRILQSKIKFSAHFFKKLGLLNLVVWKGKKSISKGFSNERLHFAILKIKKSDRSKMFAKV